MSAETSVKGATEEREEEQWGYVCSEIAPLGLLGLLDRPHELEVGAGMAQSSRPSDPLRDGWEEDEANNAPATVSAAKEEMALRDGGLCGTQGLHGST